MDISLNTNQAAKISFSPIDADGNPAKLDGPVTPNVVSGDVEARMVGNDLYLIPSDTSGDSEVRVDGDAAAGPDVDVISETINISAKALNAVSLGAGFSLVNKKDVPPAA